MSAMAIYLLVTVPILFLTIAISAFLFYTKVLMGLVDRGEKVGVDFWFVPFRGYQYLGRYARLLTLEERATWSNRLAIRLPWIAPLLAVLWFIGLITLESMSK